MTDIFLHLVIQMRVLYTGPLTRSIQLLKKTSLTLSVTSLASFPFMFLSNLSPLGVAAIGTTCIASSWLSTGLVNYCTRRYVTEISETDSECTVKTLDFYARETQTVVGRLERCSEAFGNYRQVNGSRIFFLHEKLLENETKELLMKAEKSE